MTWGPKIIKWVTTLWPRHFNGVICHPYSARTCYDQHTQQILSLWLLWRQERRRKKLKMGWFGVVWGYSRSLETTPFVRPHRPTSFSWPSIVATSLSSIAPRSKIILMYRIEPSTTRPLPSKTGLLACLYWSHDFLVRPTLSAISVNLIHCGRLTYAIVQHRETRLDYNSSSQQH